MNESIKNMLERRSIRAYKKDLVPQEALDVILEAGEYSPSGMGQQSTLMVVTQNPELVAKLSKMNADVMGSKADPFYGAPRRCFPLAAHRRNSSTPEYPLQRFPK